MSMDSGDEQTAAGRSPQTMDSWAWIGRARAAARRAAETADATEASDPEDPPEGGPGRRTPPAG